MDDPTPLPPGYGYTVWFTHKPRCLRFFKYLLLALSIIAAASAYPTNALTQPIKQDIFRVISSVPPSQRIDSAQAIYKINCRKIPLSNAMTALNGLTSIARELSDLPLECAVFDMRADYYSVNYGFTQMGVYYLDQAVNFAQQHQLKLEEGIYLHKKALYYALFKHNAEACHFFLEAQDIFNTLGLNHVPNIAIYLDDFASFYYVIGDYYDCRVYLYEALKQDTRSLRSRINMTNTLGLIYRNYQQYQSALRVFARALNMATAGKDTAWIGIANGNIGSVYFMQQQYLKAQPYIETDYRISLKYSESLNAAISLLRLAKISMETGRLDQSNQQLNEIVLLLKQDKTNTLKYQTELYRLKAIYYERSGNLKQALQLRQRYETAKDSLNKQDNIAAVDRVSLQWEKDQHLLQINQLKAESRISTIQMTFIIILLALLLITFIMMYRRRIKRAKQYNQVLVAEKSHVDEELRNATTALAIYTKSLKNKNEVIEQFRKKIDELQTQANNEKEIEKLNKLVQTHIMTDDSWNEFKQLFSLVHSSFFTNLAVNYPKISITDTRLLSLIKLGLNNREMANMLGITVEGIKKAKQRLRKKMDLSPEQDIEAVLVPF